MPKGPIAAKVSPRKRKSANTFVASLQRWPGTTVPGNTARANVSKAVRFRRARRFSSSSPTKNRPSTVTECGRLRGMLPLSSGVPGIRREAGIAWRPTISRLITAGEDTSDQFQLVSFNLDGHGALDALDGDYEFLLP